MKRIYIKLTACAIAVMMSAGVIFPAQFTSVYAAERIEDINKEDGAVVELGQKSLAGQLDAPEGIHCKSGEDYITLTWDEVDGADAYRVYKYDPANKTFESAIIALSPAANQKPGMIECRSDAGDVPKASQRTE